MIKELKIGGLNYAIQPVEWDENINGIMQFGLCHKDLTKIEINTNVSEQLQNQTIVHEMLHAVFMEAGIDLDNEEYIVTNLAPVLYQVIKDNDFDFIKKVTN